VLLEATGNRSVLDLVLETVGIFIDDMSYGIQRMAFIIYHPDLPN